jgi:disulfide oxidoreductase YuzD
VAGNDYAQVTVTIIGAPIACKEGVKDSWREVAEWAAGQLKTRFGETVEVRYYDLFDAECPPIPASTQLPLVLVDGEVLSSGRKISVPAIRKRVEGLGIGK